MPLEQIYISANTDAVDAAPITKDVALIAVAKSRHTPLERIGAIGDSANDIPFLAIPKLGLVGAPRNAQPEVKDLIHGAQNGYLSDNEYLHGFIDFYNQCRSRHLELVFSDRDGVLVHEGNSKEIEPLGQIFEGMGSGGRPLVFVLTGTSNAQNQYLIRNPVIARALAKNDCVRRCPRLFLIENGAIALNIIDGSSSLMTDAVSTEICSLLTGQFRVRLLRRIEHDILPNFHLTFSYNELDQNAKIFIPKKRTMVTLDIPREVGEIADYRRSDDSESLRSAIVDAMRTTAKEMNIPHRVLGQDAVECAG